LKALHFIKKEEEKPEILLKLNKILDECDCFFIVGGEYNNTIQPPLTNLLDHFPLDVFSHKISGICWYSKFYFNLVIPQVLLAE
jgi:NAD(P)H-dependent FMN reductase